MYLLDTAVLERFNETKVGEAVVCKFCGVEIFAVLDDTLTVTPLVPANVNVPPLANEPVPEVPLRLIVVATAVLEALVIRPYVSTVITGICVEPPYVVAETPEVANLEALNVPEEMLVALVVSVVAEVARPDTAPEAIAIATFDAAVIRPLAFTVTTETLEAPPYVPTLEFTVAKVVADDPAVVVISPVKAGNLAEPNVPAEILVALVVSVVAEVARPDTAPEAIAIATFDAAVIRPLAFTVTTETLEAPPYVPTLEFTVAKVVADEPVVVVMSPVNAGNLAEPNVPAEILVALVVSVVAEVAKPDTAPEAIAIAVFDTAVIRPLAFTITTGTVAAPPYVPTLEFTVARVVADDPAVVVISPVKAGNLAEPNVPAEMLVALVVSVVAEVARPDTAPEVIAIDTFDAAVIRPLALTV